MHRQDSTWNRQELYEKVWQFPLRTLAAEYGISDVGLAKVCRKLEIPLPGLGHWTKIACGHMHRASIAPRNGKGSGFDPADAQIGNAHTP